MSIMDSHEQIMAFLARKHKRKFLLFNGHGSAPFSTAPKRQLPGRRRAPRLAESFSPEAQILPAFPPKNTGRSVPDGKSSLYHSLFSANSAVGGAAVR
jgi:hypothetical protein